ncbi:heavy metal translocating P-type ATPase [Hoyosella sp. YIM 151337]|uniref:heavy metal translocating P-type ATPase n=1 Tax=Hoyosella sp. YIM 151337 TaxID=2992742 RepID=UPI002235BA55|nr:heavy metal translocating P-type ATPase [Hoyosella sp. YIM 151337]MCW4353052.1 heavy metal translocating P-type ATPase [Hoyosella sp. YIM 151337]
MKHQHIETTGDHAGHASAHAGHAVDKHKGHGAHGEEFRKRFWASLILSVPVVYFSHMVADLLGYTIPHFAWAEWIPPVLGTVIFVYGGAPFLVGGVREVKGRQPGMMLLIAMAISVAFLASWATTLEIGGFDLDFWWELALLIVIMLLGHWLEMRALGSASGALDALAALLPDTAERVDGDDLKNVPLDQLRPGDTVVVRPGARVPADGEIVSGSADMDESMITGESKPVRRQRGDTVVAGTVATDSSIHVHVKAIGEDTALAGIQRLVAQAQASSSRAQALADRAAAFLFYFALAAGVLTFAAWMVAGNIDDAVVRTVTVLVIACPHALGLAIPLVIAISTERAARAGILVKERLSLERMRTVDVVLFDKTGTLTAGRHEVTAVASTAGTDSKTVLALAASVERESEHPVARAIVGKAGASAREYRASEFRSLPGRGVSAFVTGPGSAGAAQTYVGGPALLRDVGVREPEDLATQTRGWRQRGASVLHVVQADKVLGAFALEDAVRPESRRAVAELHRHGVAVAMVTGDAQQVADAVAHDLGIDEVFAGVLPENKEAKVSELQQRGHRVAMVGDGVNDAPALARADVGIAIGAGTDVAIESAGVVLASDDPRGVLSVITLSRRSYRKMWENLVWATAYNIVAIPLAAGALAFTGFVLPPAMAAVLMSASTIVVAINAQFLRRVNLEPAPLENGHH